MGRLWLLIGSLRWTPLQALAEARGILFPWLPVFMAIGIGLWFTLPFEPGLRFYAGALAVVALGTALRLWGPEHGHPFAVALAALALGALLAGVRAHSVAAPILSFRYYGAIEGRVVLVDRSASDHMRLTLDQVVLNRVSPERTPERVRISLHGKQYLTPEPGMLVILTGHLAAPEGPPEPGGFDFQRLAYFERLGAIGYSRTPVLLLAPPEPWAQIVNRMRSRLSAGIQAAVPGDPGAFSSGVMTGDRSGLSLQAIEDLRGSSLTHLLAISGMNMAFLIGFVFATLRYGLALVPVLALRVNSKKLAALVSLGVAWFYLLLSGANVATERAFIMVAVMLGAVLLDRRALSLRSVAISGCILLILKPESLLSPGFQMSFAATTALIAGFGAVEGQVMRNRLPRWALPVATLVLSSVLAGFATAPYGAATFNRVADYGLLANLMTVPVMGAVVMPAGTVAALAAPFGLEALPLWVMGRGSAWILWSAGWVAGFEGALTGIIAPGPLVLPVLTLGALWLVLWRGPVRLAGIVPMVAALVLWAMAERPPLLISADGGLAGLLGPEGRALSSPRGAGFAAESWLENDGDLTDQISAAARPGFEGDKGARRFVLGDWRGVVLKGKGSAGRVAEACTSADLVIVTEAATAPPGCQVIDAGLLLRTGTLAVWPGPDGLRLQPTFRARRLWTGPGPDPEQPADLPLLLAAE
ncbi:ComEC/Rec2 family competence protein [Paracoccaceae bacterium Fryx2]|nr:ComEC/Rec2 family competence protein [Paracoccaceae bacterium Fryx2]